MGLFFCLFFNCIYPRFFISFISCLSCPTEHLILFYIVHFFYLSKENEPKERTAITWSRKRDYPVLSTKKTDVSESRTPYGAPPPRHFFVFYSAAQLSEMAQKDLTILDVIFSGKEKF